MTEIFNFLNFGKEEKTKYRLLYLRYKPASYKDKSDNALINLTSRARFKGLFLTGFLSTNILFLYYRQCTCTASGRTCPWIKEDIRRMERTLSMNYPVLRQNKRVLLYTFVKKHSFYY